MNRFDLGDINDHNYRGGVLTDSSENIIRGNFPMDETERQDWSRSILDFTL